MRDNDKRVSNFWRRQKRMASHVKVRRVTVLVHLKKFALSFSLKILVWTMYPGSLRDDILCVYAITFAWKMMERADQKTVYHNLEVFFFTPNKSQSILTSVSFSIIFLTTKPQIPQLCDRHISDHELDLKRNDGFKYWALIAAFERELQSWWLGHWWKRSFKCCNLVWLGWFLMRCALSGEHMRADGSKGKRQMCSQVGLYQFHKLHR